MFHKRNLPHLYKDGGTYFVTFRLFDSIPVELLQAWKADFEKLSSSIEEVNVEAYITLQKRFFQKFDDYLDTNTAGEHWLKQPEIAKKISDKLHAFDTIRYKLRAYCIMSNHVHVLFSHFDECFLPISRRPKNETPLSETMRLIKGATARYCNIELGRVGRFWQEESYDHLVRSSQEEENVMQYIVNNPVKAGLVSDAEDYPFTFVASHFPL